MLERHLPEMEGVQEISSHQVKTPPLPHTHKKPMLVLLCCHVEFKLSWLLIEYLLS